MTGTARRDTDRPPTAEKSVLIVDDGPAVARALRRVLEASGYTVSVASGGQLAVEAISKTAFDVVISDIQMPGMTGVELLRSIRAQDLDVPVILMTGVPTVETAIEA